MKSTSGLSICPRNCLAYADSDSTYLRWPSANNVSKASEDLPEPDSPVNTTMRLRGNSRSTFFRLCSRAPWMVILRSLGRCLRSAVSEPFFVLRGAFLISLARNASLVRTRSTMTSPFAALLRLVATACLRWWLFFCSSCLGYLIFVMISNRCSICGVLCSIGVGCGVLSLRR